MNDEAGRDLRVVQGTRTIIWDVSDLEDPRVVGEAHPVPPGASDHNLYIIGDLMYQSKLPVRPPDPGHLRSENPVEVAFFDTVPYGTNTPGFGGSLEATTPTSPAAPLRSRRVGRAVHPEEAPLGVPVSDQELDH